MQYIDMQIVRFSVVKKEMSSVLAGFIREFTRDSWRIQGHFYIGSAFVLMDDWKYPSPAYPVNHVFAKAVVTKMYRRNGDFEKTRICFEIIETFTPIN